MRKQVSYKGNILTIQIDLTPVSVKFRGGKFYKVKASGYNNGFEKKYEINTQLNLKDEVLEIESDFIEWVDMPPTCEEEKILTEIGYIR